MKISLTTSGGFAATLRRPPRVLDTQNLSEEESARLRELLASVKVPEAEDPGPMRDAMSYHVEVETESGTEEISATDGKMSPEFSALLGFIREHSSGKAG